MYNTQAYFSKHACRKYCRRDNTAINIVRYELRSLTMDIVNLLSYSLGGAVFVIKRSLQMC